MGNILIFSSIFFFNFCPAFLLATCLRTANPYKMWSIAKNFFSVQVQEIAIPSLNISITWILIVAFMDWIFSIFTDSDGSSNSIYAIFKIVKLVGFALIRIYFVYLVINLRVIPLQLFGSGSKGIRMRCKFSKILFWARFTQHELDSNR